MITYKKGWKMLECKSCHELYHSQKGCPCWASLKEAAKVKFDAILAKGGCRSCGSTAYYPQAAPCEQCPTCRDSSASRRGGISAITAGFCPVCYGLAHRRDMEYCTGCGEPYAPIAALEIDAWAGYGAFPADEIEDEGGAWRGYSLLVCPICKRSRERRLSRKEAENADAIPCLSCSAVITNAKRKEKRKEKRIKSGTSI